MNQRLPIILIVLMIVLCTVTIINFFSNRQLIDQAMEALGSAEKSIKKAIEETSKSSELVDQLQFEIQRTTDSLDILIAEHDSIIYAYKRWGSDSTFRKYNNELKVQAGKLGALSAQYNELLRAKNQLQ